MMANQRNNQQCVLYRRIMRHMVTLWASFARTALNLKIYIIPKIINRTTHAKKKEHQFGKRSFHEKH